MRIFCVGKVVNRNLLTPTPRETAELGYLGLTVEEKAEVLERFGNDPNVFECTFARDDAGYFCYTHRARSKSYPSIARIPKDRVTFIGGTG